MEQKYSFQLEPAIYVENTLLLYKCIDTYTNFTYVRNGLHFHPVDKKIDK